MLERNPLLPLTEKFKEQFLLGIRQFFIMIQAKPVRTFDHILHQKTGIVIIFFDPCRDQELLSKIIGFPVRHIPSPAIHGLL